MLNDMDTIRNKANAREWTLTNTLDFSTAYTRKDLVIVLNFNYGRLLRARLYRNDKLIDSTDTVDKANLLTSALYLLESF